MTKVLLLHNIIAPYRLPLFDELAKKRDLEVKFCKGERKDRLWKTTLIDYSFKHEVLRDISIGPFVINYTLPFKLLFNRYDVYIAGITLRDILSIFVTLFIAKLFRKPFIAWSEYIDIDFSKFLGNKLGKVTGSFLWIYMKLICRYSDFFIANSYRTKECFIKHGAPEEKIFVSPYVMPEDQIKKVSISKVDTEYRDKKVILSVGYLRKVKGVDCLIRAFKSLKTEDTVLIIAGAGPEEEKLKLLAKDDKNIYFVGYVEGEEKSKYYSIADIFVLPTLQDPWGLVVNEAMCFGLPVITTDAAGASELINGNGFVVKAGDEEELRQAIEKLLDNDTMRKEMAHKSKEIIKDYTVKHAVEPFNEAIERAMMEKVK